MSRRDRQRRRRRNRGSPLKSVVAMTAVLIVCAVTVGALAIAGWVVNVAHSAPNLSTLKPFVPGSPSQVFASDGTSMGYIWSPSVHTEIAGATIPQELKDATIAIEDRRFYQHGALDYQGILRAAIKDAVKGGNGLQGASTLTMQLVDNTYLPAPLPQQPRSEVQDRPGQARRAARGPALQELDPRQLPQRRPVRHRRWPDRVRRRRRVADVLRQARAEAEPRPGRAAGGTASGTLRVQPVPAQVRRPATPLRGAPVDGHRRLHHPGRGRPGRHQAPRGEGRQHPADPPGPLRLRLHRAAGRPRPVPQDAEQLQGPAAGRTEDLLDDRPAQAGPGHPGDQRPRVAAGRAGPRHGRRGGGLGQLGQRPHPGDRDLGQLRPDAGRLRHPGPPPDRIGVQGVRADDPDPRRRRQSQQHLLRLQAAGRGMARADPTW